MALLLHTKVTDSWHIVRTDAGVFFGYTAEQATEKASAAARAKTLAAAETSRPLPLTQSQRLSARRILLRDVAAERGIRRLSAKPSC